MPSLKDAALAAQEQFNQIDRLLVDDKEFQKVKDDLEDAIGKADTEISNAQNVGCIYACAEMVRAGGYYSVARDVLANWGITSRAEAEDSGADEHDLNVLWPVAEEE